MSLYYEASSILSNKDKKGGSLKSRVFAAKDLKNPPTKVYALLVETLKWSPILKDAIESSEVLKLERKLSPALAVLLVHDLLLAKGGVAAPKNHALRLSIEKHKARLSAELTRCRIRQGFGSIEAFRDHINGQASSADENGVTYRHPRWVRVNTLRSSIKEQLKTTFDGYRKAECLEDVLRATHKDRLYYVDLNIPDLVALPYGHDLSKTNAYLTGQIIFQDKASCFPAYLLDPAHGNGDVIDTCAAPGNKTTHVAALVHSSRGSSGKKRKVLAFERNPHRSMVLRKMVTRAGGDDLITVHGTKDFLTVDPNDPKFASVEGLLLDPSCSGTGIVGRDDEPKMHLPERNNTPHNSNSKKRKRDAAAKEKATPVVTEEEIDDNAENQVVDGDESLAERLRTLSDFQLQLIERAMEFPNAKRITYSTCSIHAEENEHVVMQALASRPAQERGWRILLRREQPTGLQTWNLRGVKEACAGDHAVGSAQHHQTTHAEVAEACIRCEKGTVEGTMGFFVAAFVREGDGRIALNGNGIAEPLASGGLLEHEIDEDEWVGFSDGD